MHGRRSLASRRRTWDPAYHVQGRDLLHAETVSPRRGRHRNAKAAAHGSSSSQVRRFSSPWLSRPTGRSCCREQHVRAVQSLRGARRRRLAGPADAFTDETGARRGVSPTDGRTCAGRPQTETSFISSTCSTRTMAGRTTDRQPEVQHYVGGRRMVSRRGSSPTPRTRAPRRTWRSGFATSGVARRVRVRRGMSLPGAFLSRGSKLLR